MASVSAHSLCYIGCITPHSDNKDDGMVQVISSMGLWIITFISKRPGQDNYSRSRRV